MIPNFQEPAPLQTQIWILSCYKTFYSLLKKLKCNSTNKQNKQNPTWAKQTVKEMEASLDLPPLL